MDRAAKYCRNAADCFAVAQLITDPHLKATMLAMANSWSALADHAEQTSELDLSHGPPPGADDHIQQGIQ
jgi:hypothetical protein